MSEPERAEVVAVGSELLFAGRRDTNADWLGERLARAGIELVARTVVGDDVRLIASVVREASERAQLVLLTGGLGPTEDDRTREGVAQAFGLELERDVELEQRLKAAFARWGLRYRAAQAKQAERPRGAIWIPNPVGTAFGFRLVHRGCLIAALPGVPAEMTAMFEAAIEPELRRPGAAAKFAMRVVRVAGRTESSVDAAVRELYSWPGLDVTILSGVRGIELLARAAGSEADARVDRFERAVRDRLGQDVWGTDDDTLPAVIGQLLLRAGKTLAVAESCTAGLIAGAITTVPGSSAWFRGGLVVYHDDLKRELAGVGAETLAEHGAVSEAAARALARGARERCGADIGIGVTGVAGPGGGSDRKPVGWVHLALQDGPVGEHQARRLPGDREQVRARTVTWALDGLRRHLLQSCR